MPNQIEISVQVEQPELTAQVSVPSVESSIPVLIVADGGGNVTIIGFNEVFNQTAESGETVNLPAAVIELEGGATIKLDPGQSYEVLKARVLNPNGTVLLKLGPDEFYQLENCTVTDTGGNSLLTIGPGGTAQAPDGTITNSLDQLIGTVRSGSNVELPDVSAYQVNGETIAVPAQKDFSCVWTALTIRDAGGNTISTIPTFPSAGIHTIPELRSGIAYARIHPSQYTTYTPGDIGWCVQNGRYDWADLDYPLYSQRLDLTSAVDWFYQLRYNNAFGNKFRFTNEAGVQAPDGRLNFASATYIIDHLTGFAFWSDSIGAQSSFTTAMIAARDSTQSGFNDWMPLTREIFFSALIANTTFLNTQSPFKVAASQNTWFGETVENSTANAWRLTTGGQATSVGSKALSGIHMFICRIHYK